jgi:hypothetical protein
VCAAPLGCTFRIMALEKIVKAGEENLSLDGREILP